LAFLREPKILIGSKSDSLKIYAIGDSFTYGMGMTPDKAFPKLLEQKLGKKFPEKKIEVLNYGRPSHGLSYVYYTIKELYETKKDENAIYLILGGWNVSDYDFARFDKQNSVKFADKAKLFLNNFRTFRFIKSWLLFKKIYYPYGNEDYVPPFWAKTNYDFDKYQKIDLDYLDKIAQYSAKNKLRIFFLNYPQNPPPPNPYTSSEVNHFTFSTKKIVDEDYIIKNRDPKEIAINSLIRFTADRYKIPLIDINKDFEQSNTDPKELFQEDYYHPSEQGDEIMAESVFKFIENKLN
jgi:lysophospholipase L1-like esterase